MSKLMAELGCSLFRVGRGKFLWKKLCVTLPLRLPSREGICKTNYSAASRRGIKPIGIDRLKEAKPPMYHAMRRDRIDCGLPTPNSEEPKIIDLVAQLTMILVQPLPRLS